MDYVADVQANSVVIHCESEGLRSAFKTAAGNGASIRIAYAGQLELATVLTKLQLLNVPFGAAGPFPPTDHFDFLRSEGLVSGNVRRITWHGPGQYVIEDP